MSEDASYSDLCALAAEHCAVLAVRKRHGQLKLLLLGVERQPDRRNGVTALLYGRTRVLVRTEDSDEMLEVARLVRQSWRTSARCLSRWASAEQLVVLAEDMGGIAGFRAEDSGKDLQPLIVLVDQRLDEPLACLQVGFEVLLVDVEDF